MGAGIEASLLTETGCPAVDLGSKPAEPVFGRQEFGKCAADRIARARDDEMQRRFLQAKLGYWAEPGEQSDGPMAGR